MKNSNDKPHDEFSYRDRTFKDLIIVLILATLVAIFIWKYFDYKIVKTKWSYSVHTEISIKLNS